eukprot:jgi/Mesen1/1307/ME000013S00793
MALCGTFQATCYSWPTLYRNNTIVSPYSSSIPSFRDKPVTRCLLCSLSSHRQVLGGCQVANKPVTPGSRFSVASTPSGGENFAPAAEVQLPKDVTGEAFDTEAFEKERHELDERARDQMRLTASLASPGGNRGGLATTSNQSNPSLDPAGGSEADGRDLNPAAEAEEKPGAWKWAIRKRIWDLLEEQNLAKMPRPVHHRIPNFVGSEIAAAQLAGLPEFLSAACVKVNPDSPQKQVRYLTLSGGKLLMTPQPRLRTGFFSTLSADKLPDGSLLEACSPAGLAKYGQPLSLFDKIKVDLIVIGSVAVDPKTGARLGKGEGYAELEYAMLRWMGAIDDSTPIVTTVRDEQLVHDIPAEKMLIHDVPVDIICTPTQIIRIANSPIPKPQGIYWDKLSPQKLATIKVLQLLKEHIEKESGRKLPSGPPEELPPTAERRSSRPKGSSRGSSRPKTVPPKPWRRQV